MIMETNYILAIIFWAISTVALILASVRIIKANRGMFDRTFIYVVIYGTFTAIFASLMNWNQYRDGQIDALKGKYKYRMEINYDQHGTPKDTIYVKEEWRKNMEKDTVVIIPIRTVRDTVIYINR